MDHPIIVTPLNKPSYLNALTKQLQTLLGVIFHCAILAHAQHLIDVEFGIVLPAGKRRDLLAFPNGGTLPGFT
jgi:hypothetical protein